jgi:uncharacterized membrane protein YecN with MAPEG domain
MHILPVYASLLALLFVLLSVRTLRLRHSLRIAIGDAGNERMLRAMRVHSNFAEYVPFCLLLVYLVEVRGAHALLVHGLGLCLLVGRAVHAWGVSHARENFRFRVAGMAMTFTTLLVSAAYLLLASTGIVRG